MDFSPFPQGINMSARNKLIEWADYADRHLGEEAGDAAALRELDKLLEKTSDCIKNRCEINGNGVPAHPGLRDIYADLKQAGY
jgi:hypothetical protein